MDDVKIIGVVEFIKYEKLESNFAIIELMTENKLITVKGKVYGVREGEKIEVDGNYVNHNIYGLQFEAKNYIRKIPQTKLELLEYLINSNIKGIGQSIAQRIVNHFDEDIINIIKNEDIGSLTKIKGVTQDIAKNIIDYYKNTFCINDLVEFLMKNNINSSISLKLHKLYGQNAINLINENPYILCQKEIGIDFLEIDNISNNFNIDEIDERRIKSAIIYSLEHNINNGHTCLPKHKLLKSLAEFLNIDEDNISECIDILIEENKLYNEYIDDKEYIFLYNMYNDERYIASRISLCQFNEINQSIINIEKAIENIEKENNIRYNYKQKEFIKSIFDTNFLVLTGGPGTGKTTTINAVIEILEMNNLNIGLCSPTGRAAQRLENVTKRKAKTIHRLLEVDFRDTKNINFIKNEKNNLKYDAIIIDEISMVDVWLFSSLLKALKPNCKIILVGDYNQLPSVGAGNVLKDIIESNAVKTIKLTEIFRQATKSLIVMNSHKIVSGEMPKLYNKNSDFFFIEEINIDRALEKIKDLYIRRLKDTYGFYPLKDIQILCPSKKGQVGTNNLNNYIRDNINPKTSDKIEIFYNGIMYREQDKIMQIKNNYEIEYEKDGEKVKGIYNGDIGIIKKIDLINNRIDIDFDGKIIQYTKDMLYQIELAYAITVHKSQGSEFEAVIIPLLEKNDKLYYRNLLYTAVTRAKKILIIVGKEKIIQDMINNNKTVLHYTGLKKFLKDELE